MPFFKVHKPYISDSSDLNKITDEGMYIAASTSKMTNIPLGVNDKAMAVLLVIDFINNVTSHQFTQILICGNTMFTREYVGRWYEWLKIGA